MESYAPRKVAESRTEQVQILMPEHINGFHRLFGGRLMEWIDIVAAVVARRHSHCNVTTVAVDKLEFQAAAYVNSTIVLRGQLTYVGRTSMEVRVDTFVEELTGERHMVNRAYLVVVAIDDLEQPTQVPPLLPETEEEIGEMEAGKRRYALRRRRKDENY